MFTQKFFDIDSLTAAGELRALVRDSNDAAGDYLALWPAVRSRLLSDVVPGRLQSIENAFEATRPGLVLEIDALVDTIRRSTRIVSTRPWTNKQMPLVREYLYLKHSNDVRGVGKGISPSALDRQFGNPIYSCSLEVDLECTRCSTVVQGHVTTLAKYLADARWVGLEVQCGTCGHKGFAGNNSVEKDICRCQSCLQRYQNSAVAVQRNANRILANMGLELQQMCRAEFAQAMSPPTVQELSADGHAFASRMYQQPSTLFDALKDLVLNGKASEHPISFENKMHEVAHRLRAEGLLDVTAACPGLHNPNELLYQALTTPWFYRSEEERQRRQVEAELHYAIVRRGAYDIESFLAWRHALEELGLVSGRYFLLPIDFSWTLLERPPAQQKAQQQRSGADKLFAYAYLSWSSQHCFPDEQSPLNKVVDLQQSLFITHMPDLLQQLREVGAAGMATELRVELARDWPDANAAVDGLKETIRLQNGKTLGARFRYTGALDPIASLLYFEMSREAIGQAEGVRLNDISRQFGSQTTPFRKHIRPAHMPFPCPCCQNEGRAYDLVLDPKGLVAGSFSCSNCGHQASLGGPNAITCQCLRCSGERDVALAGVSQSAEAIMQAVLASLEDATSKLVAKERQEQFNDGCLTGCGVSDDSWVAYASLRYAGRTELEALGTLFGGSHLTKANAYLAGTDGITPPVLAAGILRGIFSAGAPEVPSPEVRRRFLQARLLDWLNESVAESKFNVALHFDDINSVIVTLKQGKSNEVAAVAQALAGYGFYWSSIIVVPVRWKLEENSETVRQLSEAAERCNVIPRHIYAGDAGFDHTRHGKPLVPLTFPEWPSGEPVPVEEKREEQSPSPTSATVAETAEADAAVRLLKSLGYLVVPPGGKKP